MWAFTTETPDHIIWVVCYKPTAIWASTKNCPLADRFRDPWRNQLWQWLEDSCRKPVRGVFYWLRYHWPQSLSHFESQLQLQDAVATFCRCKVYIFSFKCRLATANVYFVLTGYDFAFAAIMKTGDSFAATKSACQRLKSASRFCTP